ncbi:hypothetical protein [Sorangium sp. So ce117]|uniref:hypothetical protein n=1 Tax=Sorangium sp. So ce117 TaxID=3133277 RepID=UPI003F5FC747
MFGPLVLGQPAATKLAAEGRERDPSPEVLCLAARIAPSRAETEARAWIQTRLLA